MTKNHPLLRSSILAIFLLGNLLPAICPANSASPSSLLVRWQITTESDSGTVVESETLIYRDGLVLFRTLTNQKLELSRRQLTASYLASLSRSLEQNRIGQLQANHCIGPSVFPNEITYSSVVTWFGKPGRQNRLSFSDVAQVACPPQVDNIFQELLDSGSPANYQEIDHVVTQP
jgi:hypothetical protein